jgi:Transposase DNA-binding/Transposase DDE domain
MEDLKLAKISNFEDSRSIAKEYYLYSDLPDFRLNKRAVSINSTLLRRPHESFNQAFGTWKETKAFYRFIENDRISHEMLEQALYQQGAINCRAHDKVYAINDTTAIEIKHHLMDEELGPIDQYPDHLGMFLHTTMALSEKGLPLGILNQQLWTREKKKKEKRSKQEREREKNKAKKEPIEEKESYKWLRAVELTKQLLYEQLGDVIPKTIFIGDRESDIYEYFEKIKKENTGTITRVTYNRRVEEETGKLRDHLLAQDVQKQLTVLMPRSRTRKKRKAKISIRYVPQVTLLAPGYKDFAFTKIPLGAVYVTEDNPPEKLDKKEIVDWFLLTTEPVESIEDALDIIEKYKYRWLIEMLHFVLKSGCRIEKLQFETVERYHKILIFLTGTAYEILRLTHISRIHPDWPATEILSEI